MNILKLAFELFMVYLVYKVVFDFIIPIYNTTKQMKGKMNEMQEKMNQQRQQQEAAYHANNTRTQTTAKKQVNDDYIDYEEVK